MSSVCAKPTCTDSVHLWLDFAPGDQRVIERARRGDATVGLCANHAERFTVPTGWTFERSTDERTSVDRPVAAPAAELVSPHEGHQKRTHSRGRPWFLALSDTSAEVDNSVNGPNAPVANPATEANTAPLSSDDGVDTIAEPSVGSLLYRAFHGPDRALDASRAAHDELEQRRATRVEDDESGTIELPFPPFESEHRAAVS